MRGQLDSSGQSGGLASGYFQRDDSRSTEPNAADNGFHGREEGGPTSAPSIVTSRLGCGFHKTLDRGSQKEAQHSVFGRHHHFCLSMSGDFGFAITSPSPMRSLCGQGQSFQSAVCASSSVPNLQGRAHSEGAGLAPLKGPFLITLVSESPGLITLASMSQGTQDGLRLTM